VKAGHGLTVRRGEPATVSIKTIHFASTPIRAEEPCLWVQTPPHD
jgi:hypothetical protein